jgi:asparagine synthase (glutamine-hydrolysing)
VILGAVGCEISPDPGRGFALQAADTHSGQLASRVFFSEQRFGTSDPKGHLSANATTGAWLAFAGRPLLVPAAGILARGESLTAPRLLAMLEAEGLKALDKLDGQFSIAWWSGRDGVLRLIRDRYGMEPLSYSHRNRQIVFGSLSCDVANSLAVRPGLSMQGVVEYLAHCYLPGSSTLFEGLLRVPAGALVEFSAATGSCRVNYWYRLSYTNTVAPNEQEITETYRNLLEASVVRRLTDDRLGVFLSGGMDSSSAGTFARKHLSGPISSYSFRCVGASFDESPFSRSLAKELGTQHTEVDYGELQSLEAVAAAGAMDMPFCDIGIEIGTWLLSKAAAPSVDYLMTGDGGDEIWASHPVYAAQKIVSWYDRMPIPRSVRSALVATCGLVRDSDKKRNLPVVLKRLLPDASYPKDFRHYRWKMYYTSGSLNALLSPGLSAAAAATEPFQAVTESFENYQGPDDGISPCLYSDYRTVSGCYFSRMFLARSFGVEVRMPFYDRDLVEYGARIPVNLKLEGIERTKRLFRVAMEGILPDIINHRPDKMGHSVPFKNWLRGSGVLNSKVTETLTSSKFNDRGLFRPEVVSRMLVEHQNRRHNHSHRIWALFILEQWLRQHFDSASASSVALPGLKAA